MTDDINRTRIPSPYQRLARQCLIGLAACSVAVAAAQAAPKKEDQAGALKWETKVDNGEPEGAVEMAAIAPEELDDGLTRSYALSLKNLGASYPMHLRGIDGSNSVPFNIRNDEVVTDAKLRLRYSYSPSLMPDLSQINVLVNEELAYTIPVSKRKAGKTQEESIEIPVWLIGSFNRLRLQLVGHYTLECEDPMHSTLWATISNESELELTVAPIEQSNDLGLLPEPFFDRRDPRQVELPFVFMSAPDAGTLEAAGIVSSWFGALADYRGAAFPVDFTADLPPTGNAVLFAVGQSAKDLLGSAPLGGPTLAIIPNPNDAMGKLLVVLGRSVEELKVAALALTLGSDVMNGQAATISSIEEVAPRKPYDAPRWLPSDRPVKFGELAPNEDFSVSGYSPDTVRVSARVPPDLFGWRDEGVPVHLKYRYTPRPVNDRSTLTVTVNEGYIRTLPLLSREELEPSISGGGLLDDETFPVESDFRIPLYRFGRTAELQYRFQYDYQKQGACRDIIIDNARSGIDPDSTIDISGYDHYIAMPNLSVFAGAGYPFTRLADLSETAVVMPNSQTAGDVSAFLGLMGFMGRSTGYPVTGVVVTDAGAVSAVGDRDLLVIDAGGRQPLMKSWERYTPAQVSGRERAFALSDLPKHVMGWFSSDPRENNVNRGVNLGLRSDGLGGAVMGFESPLSSGRSVVVVSSSGDASWSRVLAAVSGDEQDLEGGVRGNLAVIAGNKVTSVVGEQTYYVGQLSFWNRVRWFLSQHPVMLLLLTLMAVILLALILYLLLRGRASRRLAEKH